VGVGDHLIWKERVQRGLHARRRPLRHHAARHEPHHLGVAHRLRLAQRRQPAEGEPSEALAADGAEVGAAALHQQGVTLLGGGVAAARLHQPGVLAHEVGEMNQLIERVGPEDFGRPATPAPL
jgi:hypothetical protein